MGCNNNLSELIRSDQTSSSGRGVVVDRKCADSPSGPAPQSGRRGGTGRRKWRRVASFRWSRSSRECDTAGRRRPDISYTRRGPTWTTTQSWLTTASFIRHEMEEYRLTPGFKSHV